MTASLTAYTVYTKPDCPNCEKTKHYFGSKGITYTAVDITEEPAAPEYITTELGYSQAPVVLNNPDDQDHWSGLRRDKLVQAAMSHKAAWGPWHPCDRSSGTNSAHGSRWRWTCSRRSTPAAGFRTTL